MHKIVGLVVAVFLCAGTAWSAYQPAKPRELKPGEVAVDKAGNYAKAGTTYVLTKDITSARTAVFLGKDVILDLNGHTLTYADGYQNVANFSFEDGTKHWDLSKAPDAKVKDVRWTNRMHGNFALALPEGQEIASAPVKLPVAKRAYYAMVAVADESMRVGVQVEDELGEPVECTFMFGGNKRPCCPEYERAPKKGGGVVFALVFGKPAGSYRIRVKAMRNDCLIDAVDIRPAMDAGIGIVEGTVPWAYYKCILDGDSCAFFDYDRHGSACGKPAAGIPAVSGKGAVTIRNGVIRSGSRGIRTWGILSTAKQVRVKLENVKIENTGINANAMRCAFADMKDCRIELDSPWIIDRHRQPDRAVNLFGRSEPSHIAHCAFIGGQGQLNTEGANSLIHDNLFVNKQTVVNHYSLGASGGGTKIYHNKFQPEEGSGILLGNVHRIEIYENEFKITSGRPVNEYCREDYSVNAIRLTDYNRSQGNARGWNDNNHIHHNKILLNAKAWPKADKRYKPMTYAIFMSVGGGQNRIHDNEITIQQEDPSTHERFGAYAFYVGGSNQGGIYHDNKIETNVTPVWIGNMYGQARNVTLFRNTFIKAKGAGAFPWFKFGYGGHNAQAVLLCDNVFKGTDFSYRATKDSQFDRGHMLRVRADAGTALTIRNGQGKVVAKGETDKQGLWEVALGQHRYTGQDGKPQDVSMYTVAAGDLDEIKVKMDKDQEVKF